MRRALIALLLALSCSSGSECSEVAVRARSEVEARFELHNGLCARDSDCAEVPVALSCFKGCPGAVLALQKEDAFAELDSVDLRVCSSGCTVTSGCLPSYAGCRAGRCLMIEGVRDAGSGDGGSPDGG